MKWNGERGLRESSSDLALALLAIAVVAAVYAVLTREPEFADRRTSGSDSSNSPSATPSPNEPTPSEPTPSEPTPSEPIDDPALDGIDSLLVFGDGAARAPGLDGRWVRRLADAQGWQLDNRARPDTGYLVSAETSVCGLPTCFSFSDTLPLLVRQEVTADVVVVVGGAADAALRPRQVGRGIKAFYDDLRRQFPDATVVVFNPFLLEPDEGADLEPVSATVADAVRDIDGTYLDVGQPFLDSAELPLPERVDEAGVVLEEAVLAALVDAGA